MILDLWPGHIPFNLPTVLSWSQKLYHNEVEYICGWLERKLIWYTIRILLFRWNRTPFWVDLKFEQNTPRSKHLSRLRRILETARNHNHGSKRTLAAPALLSDGICEDHDAVRNGFVAYRVVCVFLVIDNCQSTKKCISIWPMWRTWSILLLKSPFLKLRENYMDTTFPFDFYVTVKTLKLFHKSYLISCANTSPFYRLLNPIALKKENPNKVFVIQIYIISGIRSEGGYFPLDAARTTEQRTFLTFFSDRTSCSNINKIRTSK
jgi:hypothetical protein